MAQRRRTALAGRVHLACLGLVLVALVACSTNTTQGSAPRPTVTSTPAPVSPSPPSPPAPPTTRHSDGDSAPAAFNAASVTFVSLRLGWVLGTAPCPASPCTAILRTDDGGKTWQRIPAPPVTVGTDVTSIRFATPSDGWLFGPVLWTTHDGGQHWSPTSLPGTSRGAHVSALEASAGKVHAAVVDGSTSKVRVETSAVDADTWTESPTTVGIGAGPVPHAELVLQKQAGWVVEIDRTVIGGAQFEAGGWIPWDPPCLHANGPLVFAASMARDVVAVCDEGVWGPPAPSVRTYVSKDGGGTFQETVTQVALTSVSAVATPAPGTIVAAGSTGGGVSELVASFDGGATWSPVYTIDSGQTWAEIGFTSSEQGVAVTRESDRHPGTLLMTADGGHTWRTIALG